MAVPLFEAPTRAPGGSAAVQALNREDRERWEAFGMTSLQDGMAVLLERPIEDLTALVVSGERRAARPVSRRRRPGCAG